MITCGPFLLTPNKARKSNCKSIYYAFNTKNQIRKSLAREVFGNDSSVDLKSFLVLKLLILTPPIVVGVGGGHSQKCNNSTWIQHQWLFLNLLLRFSRKRVQTNQNSKAVLNSHWKYGIQMNRVTLGPSSMSKHLKQCFQLESTWYNVEPLWGNIGLEEWSIILG